MESRPAHAFNLITTGDEDVAGLKSKDDVDILLIGAGLLQFGSSKLIEKRNHTVLALPRGEKNEVKKYAA